MKSGLRGARAGFVCADKLKKPATNAKITVILFIFSLFNGLLTINSLVTMSLSLFNPIYLLKTRKG
jgi:hypothetical protein